MGQMWESVGGCMGKCGRDVGKVRIDEGRGLGDVGKCCEKCG